MINLKQMELAHQMANQITMQFPKVEVLGIRESGIYPNHLWVEVLIPKEDDEFEVLSFAGDMAADFLVDYGHHITAVACAEADRNFYPSQTSSHPH